MAAYIKICCHYICIQSRKIIWAWKLLVFLKRAKIARRGEKMICAGWAAVDYVHITRLRGTFTVHCHCKHMKWILTVELIAVFNGINSQQGRTRPHKTPLKISNSPLDTDLYFSVFCLSIQHGAANRWMTEYKPSKASWPLLDRRRIIIYFYKSYIWSYNDVNVCLPRKSPQFIQKVTAIQE